MTATILVPAGESMPHPSTDAVALRGLTNASPASWRSDRRDCWVGRLGRVLLGRIERSGADYLATDRRGSEIGRFASLADAETAVGATAPALADAIDRSRQRIAMLVAASAVSLRCSPPLSASSSFTSDRSTRMSVPRHGTTHPEHVNGVFLRAIGRLSLCTWELSSLRRAAVTASADPSWSEFADQLSAAADSVREGASRSTFAGNTIFVLRRDVRVAIDSDYVERLADKIDRHVRVGRALGVGLETEADVREAVLTA